VRRADDAKARRNTSSSSHRREQNVHQNSSTSRQRFFERIDLAARGVTTRPRVAETMLRHTARRAWSAASVARARVDGGRALVGTGAPRLFSHPPDSLADETFPTPRARPALFVLRV
jgi:hypothetical protein